VAASSRRRWGWHELRAEWARRLVEDAHVGPKDLVLDVGAGRGALTAVLVETGARVIAVEAHPERARHLRTRFGRQVVVVQTDARDLRLPRRPYHVVANPPFAITTPLLRRVLQPGSRLISGRLVLQDHAARRWVEPGAPAWGRWSREFSVSLGGRLPRRAFSPPPHVDTRVLIIETRAVITEHGDRWAVSSFHNTLVRDS
jgi:23S rRNA (adenine-N6)-dimethyltransferase